MRGGDRRLAPIFVFIQSLDRRKVQLVHHVGYEIRQVVIGQPLTKACGQQQILFGKVGSECFLPCSKNWHTFRFFFKHIQQNGVKFSDTLLGSYFDPPPVLGALPPCRYHLQDWLAATAGSFGPLGLLGPGVVGGAGSFGAGLVGGVTWGIGRTRRRATRIISRWAGGAIWIMWLSDSAHGTWYSSRKALMVVPLAPRAPSALSIFQVYVLAF